MKNKWWIGSLPNSAFSAPSTIFSMGHYLRGDDMLYLELPDADYLRSVFRYVKRNGKLYWKKRISRCNKIHKEVGWGSAPGKAYLRVMICGCTYHVHRIIWKMVTGEMPRDMQIDHNDRDRLNNRWGNLSMVTPSKNGKNLPLPKNNTSGIMGVRKQSHNLWCADIVSNKVSECVYFRTKEEAISWRKQKEREYGFHKNHGVPVLNLNI